MLVDTERYINEAAAWRRGTFEISYHLWYSGYVLFLACFSDPISQVYWIIGVQQVVAFVAFLALLKLFDLQNKIHGLLLALFVLYIPYHQWNVCVLTESLFCSAIIGALYSHGLQAKPRYPILFAVCLIAVCLLRPNGFLVAIAYVGAVVWYYRKLYNYVLWLAITLCVGLMLWFVDAHTETFYFFIKNSLVGGEYICGYPSPYKIPMESVTFIDSHYEGSIIKLFHILKLHPWTCVKLIVFKIFYLLFEIRPFYNRIHNIASLSAVMILYGLVVKNIRPLTPFKTFSMLVVGLNVMLVALTYTDWDGRFFSALLPCFICMALPQSPGSNSYLKLTGI